jgi:sugar lactone lactonase YvrE
MIVFVNLVASLKKIITMKFIFTFLFSTAVITAFSQNLTGVESVEFDPVSERFLVTNGSSIVFIDDNEDADGTLATGAGADYGMEVMNGVLWAIDNNQIKGYNVSDGSLLATANVSGASFLNGMASDGESRLWVTDFSLKKIHEINVSELSNPVVTQIVANTVSTPNGIVYDGENNRLIFVNWGSNAAIKAVDLSNNTMSTLTTTMLGNCDGIDNDSYGNYYVSSWSPVARITRFNSDFSVNETITVTGLSSPADICYAQSIDTLAIPNSGNNTVRLVGFAAPVSIQENSETTDAFSIYPNPLSINSVMEFDLKESQRVKIDFLDMNGKIAFQVTDEIFPSGRNKILLGALDLSSGNYICRVQSQELNSQLPVVVNR